MNLWPVEHFYSSLFGQISADLERKVRTKVFNWSEVYFIEETSYKVYILVDRGISYTHYNMLLIESEFSITHVYW